ncbi:unnamed protein product [Caenorhabditis nigoni]
MTRNKKGETKTGENPKIDSQSEKSEILEKLNSQEQKVDKIQEKLQEMEDSMAKISKLSSVEKNVKEKTFKLKHSLKNAENFDKENGYVPCEEEEHFNAKWHMIISSDDETDLKFYVVCKPNAPVDDEWSIEAKVDFKIGIITPRRITKTIVHRFDIFSYSDYVKFLWEDVETCIADDGMLNFEVEVEIRKMSEFENKYVRKFDESEKDVSDAILVVQDIKFYVSKMYLAAQSPFFKALFLGSFSESNMSEIPLTGIEPDHFRRFLEALYGESVINDFTVEEIMQLADMYATPTVVRKCEEFLLEKSRKPTMKLLEMALRYNSESLKEKCMSGIETLADFQSILPEDIQSLSPSVMAELLEKSLSLR